MKLIHLFILFAVLFSVQTVFADCIITSTLRVGSKGAEVECLQTKVGVVADGSFGPLTKVAVMVFQSSNKLVVDGIVGPLSRLTLNGLISIMESGGNYPVGCTGNVGYSPTTGVKCDSRINSSVAVSLPELSQEKTQSTNTAQKINLNLVNLDQFINAVVEVNRKNGKSETDLKLIADTLRKVVTSSDIDYNKKFEELLINESKLSANFNPHPFLGVLDKVIGKALSFLGITPPVAQASTGIPFGGALVFPFRCDYNWMITITPLPPTGVILLSYFDGTQGFASYNIPFTKWLLGFYTPPGLCAIDEEVFISTEGIILPMTGSSPL